MRKWGLLILLLLLGGSAVGIGYGVWLRTGAMASEGATVNPLAHLPDYVQNATTDAPVAYQFAIDNPEVLKQIPCYCGCEETLGHKHNLACYITAFNADDSVAEYSDHAVYWTTCLDITRVVIEMLGKGKAVAEIHQAIDVKYGYTEPHTHETDAEE